MLGEDIFDLHVDNHDLGGDLGWDVTFTLAEIQPAGVRIDWRVIERCARCTDGTYMYMGPEGMTDVRTDASIILEGQYRNDHNGERFFFDTVGQPDMEAVEVDDFAAMLVAVRDWARELARDPAVHEAVHNGRR